MAAGGRATDVIDDRPRSDPPVAHDEPVVLPPSTGLADVVARPPRTQRRDRRRVVGGPARRARVLLVVALLGLAVAAPLAARADRDGARIEARAVSAERDGAAGFRAEVDAAEAEAVAQAGRAATRAAEALDLRNQQRARLAALGLNEQTIEAFLAEALADTVLVEGDRDRTTADVDRQAVEIPQMESCLVTARQAINRAFNTVFDPNLSVPGPSDLCRALLGG